MFTHLRRPETNLAKLSLAAALFLGVIGALGCAFTLFAAVVGNDWWSDTRSDQLFAAAFFAVAALGAVGFEVMDRRPLTGLSLAVLGSLALGTILVWTLLVPVLAMICLAIAFLRARELTHPATDPHGRAPA